jgi:hypothetical protein
LQRFFALMQPSSASIERFFSLIKASMDEAQANELPATFETRCMVLYNEKK